MGRKKASLLPMGLVAFWLVVWQLAAMVLAAAYPHGDPAAGVPIDVLFRLGQLAVTSAFWQTVGWSAVRIFAGFLISTALAVVLASLASWKTWLRELMAPWRRPSKRCRWHPSSSWPGMAHSRSLSLLISA